MKSRNTAIIAALVGLALLGLSLTACTPVASSTSPQPGKISAPPATSSPAPAPPASSTLKLTVTQPQDNDTVNTGTVQVKGQTSPDAAISANEEIAVADDTGAFAVTVSLEPGPNLIEVVASDDNGNIAEVDLVVIRGG